MNVVTLIADIIGSREIPDRRAFQRHLKSVLAEVNSQATGPLLSPYTLTIGDEFQAVHKDFGSIIPDVIHVLTRIHPAQLRVAVGYGPLSTDINPHAALEMDGKAFNDARELMDQLKTRDQTIVQIIAPGLPNLELVNICLTLFSNAIASWKPNTLQIMSSLLKRNTVADIAEHLNITRRAVNKNIATNHLRDYLTLSSILTTELHQRLNPEIRG